MAGAAGAREEARAWHLWRALGACLGGDLERRPEVSHREAGVSGVAEDSTPAGQGTRGRSPTAGGDGGGRAWAGRREAAGAPAGQ